MIVNELAQWAVLLVLAVFVVGLTRQLGRFMVDPREAAALQQGPAVGKRLPKTTIPEEARERFQQMIGAFSEAWGAMIVLREGCDGCSALVDRLVAEDHHRAVPILALSLDSSPEYQRKLSTAADIVVLDDGRAGRTGLSATPFVMLVDRDLRVVHKQITSDLAGAVTRWRVEVGSPLVSSNGKRSAEAEAPART